MGDIRARIETMRPLREYRARQRVQGRPMPPPARRDGFQYSISGANTEAHAARLIPLQDKRRKGSRRHEMMRHFITR